MKNAAVATTHVNEHVSSQLGVALLQIMFRASVVLTVLVIFLVGIWTVAALVGGTLAAGGPFEFVRGWFSAVSGT